MADLNLPRPLEQMHSILPGLRAPSPTSYALAILLAVLAVIVRLAIEPWVEGVQFITLFPAVVLAALLLGSGPGLVAVAVSAMGWWLFLENGDSRLSSADVLPMAIFLIVGSMIAIAVGALRHATAAAESFKASLQARVEELQRSQDLLNALFEAIPDAVFLKAASSGRPTYALMNAAAETLTGRPRSEILGKTDHEFRDDAAASQSLQEDMQVLHSNQPLEMQSKRLETEEGLREVEVRKFPVISSGSEQRLILSVIRDVTERRQLEEKLRQAQRMDAVGQLTGGIAHDFNNLLAIAIGNLDLLEDEVRLAPESKELLEAAREACLRGADLTGRLLAFARKQTLQPRRLNLNALIQEYTKLLGRIMGADINLRLDLLPEVWEATVDQGQLEAAITNLATNARDAMPNGGNLTISTRNVMLDTSYTQNHADLPPGDYVAVEVSDTGHGMNPEVAAQAVEPFFTTKDEGKGTGLGLSMVFGFAKQSNGHVRVYSEVGHGTTITLLLPRAERTSKEEKAPTKPPVPRAKAGETVLLAEDNSSLRRIASSQLTGLGYRVLEAEDGPSALQVLKREPGIDLLLTDIIMPGGLSGVDVGREARKLRSDLKLMYMSGFPEAAFGDRAHLDPDVILMRKPFRQAELAARVREALDRQDWS